MRRTAAILVGLGLLAAACGGWVGPTSGPTSVRPSASVAFSAPSAQPSGEARARRASKPKLVDLRVGGFEVGFGEYAITTETKAIRPGSVTLAVRNG
ncbi:MAG TPA: hypothetical protein VEM93_10440, partial [Actinomycetota bacterium]|nr:hypothetical protein [Actinomycetota bacterium]